MRTRQEIKNIDNDLDLFDLDDWCFENHYNENKDYYDVNFGGSIFKPSLQSLFMDIPLVLYTVLFIGLFGVIIGIAMLKMKPDIDYQSVLALDTVMQQKREITYVDGVECDNEVIIEASKIFTDYFTILNNETGYDYLDSLCINESHLNKVYKNYVKNMSFSYDMNDCYARLIRYFGSYCVLNKIQKVVYKDGVYYCYMNMTIPSEQDIQVYIRLYSYNFTKHFTVTDVNEANIVRYLYSMEGVSKIPCSEQVVCITMKKNTDGKLYIYDDSEITSICTRAYTKALNEVAALLGSSRIGK